MRVLRSAWMMDAERRTVDEVGIPVMVLMENAAREWLRVIEGLVPARLRRRVLVVAGRGNNGGDGIAIARSLFLRGVDVRVALIADPAELKPDCAAQLAIADQLQVPWKQVRDPGELGSLLSSLSSADSLIVDALFGTGLDRPLREGLAAEVVRRLNASGLPVASVDLPSGLSEAFLPEEGEVVRTRWTVALGALKVAHLFPDGNPCCGKTRVAEIGIPPVCMTAAMEHPLTLSESADFGFLARPRSREAHKGTFGHVLCLAGSADRPGAAVMAAMATLKAGAGRCTVAVPAGTGAAIACAHPELMTVVCPPPAGLSPEFLAPYSVVLAGPGWGTEAEKGGAIAALTGGSSGPLVLDADALTLAATRPDWLPVTRTQPLVLTPHVGEFARLTGLSAAAIRSDRIGTARAYAREIRAHVILKGHHTVIASPDGRVSLNSTGNPGMATAGSGDVLAGVVAGLLAESGRGADPHEVLAAAVFAHGLAGDLAARRLGERSLRAGDLLRFLPAAFRNIDACHPSFAFA